MERYRFVCVDATVSGRIKRNGIVLLFDWRNAAVAPGIGRSATMPWEPEGGDHAEQLLQEHADDEEVVHTWPRQSGSDDRQVLTAQAATADAVRARDPAPQEHPAQKHPAQEHRADERPHVDSPP